MEDQITPSHNWLTYSILALLLLVVLTTSFYLGRDFIFGSNKPDKEEVIDNTVSEESIEENNTTGSSDYFYSTDPFKESCKQAGGSVDGEPVVFSNTVCLD